ncbi:tyrosyl-DNA phosphodiesterase 2 isoform X2 [Rhineura floridana]|uniref:tyrosyl-DNA phosphodiesterase 2 isoform X2 n=1 Tax=Rhineura floridana TaxID=261503 RepID=UPI002AC85DA9|nr:tyrosyl-DNA phosphodiesterase 2 isoform X2 [Rhineura floridana]
MDGGSVVQGMEQATPEDRTLERQPQPSEEEEEKQRELLEKHRKCLCSEFASVSGSDTAIAQCYLAENEWDMQRALNSYFEPPLEEQHVERHTLPVVESLYNPDVVFLQEVIPPVFNYLQKRAVSYTIIPGNTDGYFTVILIKKSRVRVLKHEITPFPTTSMMRNLLAVHATISGNELCLMTSHLESTKNHSEERLNQLKLVLAKMMEVPESTTVIFGGDTNLRDKEVAKLGGLPNNVLDIWEFLGKPEHCCYTWDTSQNTNLDARYKCKLRFDRLFLRAASAGGQIIPQSLDLIGLEKLDCGRFPSDHWGLLCNFAVIL